MHVFLLWTVLLEQRMGYPMSHLPLLTTSERSARLLPSSARVPKREGTMPMLGIPWEGRSSHERRDLPLVQRDG